MARRRQVACVVGSMVYMFGGTHPDPAVPAPTPSRLPEWDQDDDHEEREHLKELNDLWVLDMGEY